MRTVISACMCLHARRHDDMMTWFTFLSCRITRLVGQARHRRLEASKHEDPLRLSVRFSCTSLFQNLQNHFSLFEACGVCGNLNLILHGVSICSQPAEIQRISATRLGPVLFIFHRGGVWAVPKTCPEKRFFRDKKRVSTSRGKRR